MTTTLERAAIPAGIYPNMPFEEYLAIDAVSQTVLKVIERSPLHCRHFLDNPPEPSPAMNLGTLLHTGKLEPIELMERYVVMPAFNLSPENQTGGKNPKPSTSWSTSFCKEQVAVFEKAMAETGRTIVSQDDYDSMNGMLASLSRHPVSSNIFGRDDRPETVLVWENPDTKLLCKARCDAMMMDQWPSIVDLKTTKEASEYAFCNTIARFGYHVQAAHYVEGAQVLTGRDDFNFVIVAVENTAPFGVNCFAFDEQWLGIGRRKRSEMLATYRKCSLSGDWPGYSDRVVKPRLPRWLELSEEGTR